MKKLSLFAGLFFISVILFSSCGSETSTPVTPGETYIFQSDLIEYSGNVIGEKHIYFKTTKRGKIQVEFTGETDAGNSNFVVNIRAASDTTSLASTNIYLESDQAALNQVHTITSDDLSAIDPLYLMFTVALSRPPSGDKFVRMKNIKVKAL